MRSAQGRKRKKDVKTREGRNSKLESDRGRRKENLQNWRESSENKSWSRSDSSVSRSTKKDLPERSSSVKNERRNCNARERKEKRK